MTTPHLAAIRADAQTLLDCVSGVSCPSKTYCTRVAQTLLILLPEPLLEEESPPDAALQPNPDWSAA